MNIAVAGQLVGVVGPNGCGKSNVIDAVRWVLGESQAKHLRGETMQDVIFNGSGNRKPVSRASVELIFDNAQGRAAGQWSQYAEISVKRVLTRNGESSYYINGTHVRRRDVQDIFLGTGLGPRAYAIIEQGMISRIIEAKPDELRVFLEEAAGVSKYKERRRETELRLTDTRENLARLDDILTELTQQIAKLESQAQVAQHYQALQAQLKTTHDLLAFSRKRDAQASRERFSREIEKLSATLETQAALAKEWEDKLEAARDAHYQAGEALHAAQGRLYEANAEAARLDQALQHIRDNRRRLEAQLATVIQQLGDIARNQEQSGAELLRWQEQSAQATERVGETQMLAEESRATLPDADEAYQACQQRVAEGERELALAEQEQSVEETRESHALKLLSQLQARKSRLTQEQMALSIPDPIEIERCEQQVQDAEEMLQQEQERLHALETALPGLEAARKDALQAQQEAGQQLAGLEAHLSALQTQQSRLDNNQKLTAWLGRHQLHAAPRLWQAMSIQPGWEDALESALGTRLNALRLDALERATAWLADAPPGTVALFGAPDDTSEMSNSPTIDGLRPLFSLIESADSGAQAFLREALTGVFVLEDASQGWAASRTLPPGARLVSREGHMFSRNGVVFHGPQSELHGVLQRQREIDDLKQRIPSRQAELQGLREGLAQGELRLQQCHADSRTCRGKLGELQQRHHSLQMQALKLAQNAQAAAGRAEQLQRELADIRAQEETENEQLAQCQRNMELGASRIDAVRETVDGLIVARQAALEALNTRRQQVQAAERAAQEAVFFEKTCRDKIAALQSLAQNVDARLNELRQAKAQLEEELIGVDEQPLAAQLQAAQHTKTEREQALAGARQGLEELAASLRQADEQRLAAEQGLQPLRERITDIRMKEQEARLLEEQFQQQLAEAAANLDELAELLDKKVKSAALASDIARLNQDIAELGAVNLAALPELQQATERRAFLDAQATDLRAAVETLEGAIRRIDRETGELLQETYDTVNRNFSEMFPAIFGGGQASLTLIGEHILDAGLQVMAQPPGKKNSSIHLLSGGEKALTALALVFSFFRLNPAPFCLLDEVDAPLDDANTMRYCDLVQKMSQHTQFLFISHNKLTMEMATHLVGITMQESGVSRVVAVDIEAALRLREEAVAY